jgi:hypothetical protein
MPAPGRCSKRTRNVMQGSVLIPTHGRSSRFRHEADHLIAPPTDPERGADQRFRWSEAMWSPPPESNRRPHPYHGTTGNRCADRRLPRSRPTVRAEVIGSPSMRLCAHFRSWCSSQRRAMPDQRSPNSAPCPFLDRSLAIRSVMASVVGAIGVVGPQRHGGVGRLGRRAVNLNPRAGIPRPGHSQTKVSGPGGGRGRTRYSRARHQPSRDRVVRNFDLSHAPNRLSAVIDHITATAAVADASSAWCRSWPTLAATTDRRYRRPLHLVLTRCRP